MNYIADYIPDIQMDSIPGVQTIKTMSQGLCDSTTAMTNGMNKLYTSGVSLSNGINELSNSTTTMKNGLSKLINIVTSSSNKVTLAIDDITKNVQKTTAAYTTDETVQNVNDTVIEFNQLLYWIKIALMVGMVLYVICCLFYLFATYKNIYGTKKISTCSIRNKA
eukprot:188037_1